MPNPEESEKIRQNVARNPVGQAQASYLLGEYQDPDTTPAPNLYTPDDEFMSWARLQGGNASQMEAMARIAHAKYRKQFRNFASEPLSGSVRATAPAFKTRREIFRELNEGSSVAAGKYLIIEWRIKPAGPQSEATGAACGCGCGCGCGG